MFVQEEGRVRARVSGAMGLLVTAKLVNVQVCVCVCAAKV